MDDIQELYYLFPDLKDHILIEKKIGQGTFSFVYLGHFLRNEKEKLALKYVIPTSSPSRTQQEIECLLNIGGQDNVVGVLSVLRNKSHILILMPFIDHVAFHDTFLYWNLNECKEYIKNLIIALNRVHQCGIIHRDVKPSNFLYDRHKHIFALVDFGLAQSYDKSSENIFAYELNSNKKANPSKLENTPTKHNLISLTKKNINCKPPGTPVAVPMLASTSTPSHTSQHLVLQNPKRFNSILNECKPDANSMPHTPTKEPKPSIPNSFSFDCNLQTSQEVNKNANNKSFGNSSSPSVSVLNEPKNVLNALSKQPSFTKTSLQKYYSFQKSAYTLSENKCTCFNMPFVCEICTTRTNKWAPRAGTAGFRAPEVLFRSTYQTPSVDIWSAGIIFLSILTGRYPFFKAVDDNMAIMQLISLFGVDPVRKAALKYGESLVCSYDKKPTELKELCVGLRRTATKAILNTKNKFQHENVEPIIEFPDAAYDLLKKLLELDSDKRFTADDALKHSFFSS